MATETRILSRAPTRIDLAGGTVDLWPLSLLSVERPESEPATTINLGISLFAETELTWVAGHPGQSDAGQIIIQSRDQSTETRLSWEELNSHLAHTWTELPLKLLRTVMARKASSHWARGTLTLRTHAQSPAGAGLGGSSTLAVSILGAIERWLDPQWEPDEARGVQLIRTVRDVETTVIRVPAGVQDYYAATFGCLQTLRWYPARSESVRDPSDRLKQLESRILLFYSGQSRNSGINNWSLFQQLVQGDPQTRQRFSGINAATRSLEHALAERDWVRVGQAIGEEWSHRKGLAPGISTPEIDRAFTAAIEAGAASGKICGAGGGGCFFVYLPQRDADLTQARATVIDAVTRISGIRHLPFEAVPHGLEIR